MTFSLVEKNYNVNILDRASKAVGKYKNAFNEENKSPSDMKGKKGKMDFDQVEAEDLTKEVLH